MSKSTWKSRVAGYPPRNTNVTTTLPAVLGQADTTLELPRPLATETWVRHKRASKKKNPENWVLLRDLWKENRFRAPKKRKRPQSILSAPLFFTWSVTDYALYLPITQAKRYPSTVADTASNKEVGKERDDPQQSHLKHPLTSAGSICSVLYRERQSFKTSFPSPSLFSVVHLVSITVASLTHGLLVTLVWREKNAGIRNNKT